MQGNEIEEEVTEMKAWQDKIRSVVPYTPGEQPNRPNMIKLNTNENPYPPAPGVRDVLDHFDEDRLRLYPDPTAGTLVGALADYYHVGKDQVFTGVGSDDVLAIAFMTFFNSGKPILFPDITYSFYDVWARLFHIPYSCPPLDEQFRICPEDYYVENGGIVLANPNAPTSIFMPLQEIEAILQHNQDVIVIVDEAYIDFGGISAVELLPRYPNLVVVQTFSKSRAMAGMRIGYAMASPLLIQALNAVKASYNSYTMNRAAIEAGTAAAEDTTYFRECCEKIMATRARTAECLKEMGFTCLDSCTNFLFASHPSVPAEKIYQKLKERHIFVRYFNKPRINQYLRITIGTDEQMERFCSVLQEILNY